MKLVRWMLAVLLLGSLVAGCSKKKDSTPTAANPSAAADLVNQANASLGTIIAGMIAGPPPERPSDIDFNAPYSLYQQALAQDPLNKDARFGIALLGLVTLTTDTEVNAAFDEWAAYLTSNVPFEAPPATGPLGVPLRLGRARDVLGLPYERLALTQVALARGGLNGATPQLGNVQNILEQRALPRLTQALAYLQTVATDPSYQFIVTPAMQGDPGADPVEIDHTDILALRAGCGVLTALCDMAVAYNLNFATYDSSGLVQAFTPGSGWMALRTGGAARLAHARVSILDAVTDGEGCLNSLESESDPQDDDVIRFDPGSFTPASAESARTYLAHTRTAMNAGFRITSDWDGDGATPPVPLVIVPAALFNNPPPDWKALLPGYSAGAVRRPLALTYTGSYGGAQVQVTIPSNGYYSGVWSLYADGGVVTSSSGYGDAAILAALQPVAQADFESAAAEPGWGGYFSGNVSYYGSLTAGTQNIIVSHSSFYSLASHVVFVPTLTWNAASFAQWTWPDPTFRGLLPGITTTGQLYTLFGIQASDWQRVVVLDWTDSGFAPAP